MTVAIVLDSEYSNLQQLVAQMPVWAIESESNRRTAESMWKVRGADAHQGLTLFKVFHDDAEMNLIDVIGDVELHHGIYSSGSKIAVLRILGALPSQKVRQELEKYGLENIQLTIDGFEARILEAAIQS